MVFVESVLERIGETLTSGLKALTSSLRAMVDEGDGASPLGALVDDHLAIVAAGTATPAAAVIEALRSVRSSLVEKLDALMQVGRCVSFLIAQIIPCSSSSSPSSPSSSYCTFKQRNTKLHTN